MKKIYLTAIMGLSVLAAACSSELSGLKEREVELDTNSPICLTAGMPVIEAEQRSRAVIDEETPALSFSVFRANETYPTTWTEASAIGASLSAGSTNVTWAEGSTQYYTADGKNTKLIAVYPAIGTGITWDKANGEVTYTALDGMTDVMATQFSDAVNKTTGATTPPALLFEHMLALVKISVWADGQDAIDLWGDLEKVTIAGRHQDCIVTLPAPNASTPPTSQGSGTTTALTVKKKDGATAPTLTVTATAAASPQEFGYCMFPPNALTPTEEKLSLSVTTSVGGTATVTVPLTKYEKGNYYEIKLKYSKAAITATATVKPWGTPTSIDASL